MWTRDRGLERSWRRRVRMQRTSGLSIRAFCEAEGVPESAFYFWRGELQRRAAESSGRRGGRGTGTGASADAARRFVPVVVTAGVSTVAPARESPVLHTPSPVGEPAPPATDRGPPVLELVHPGGVVVRVAAGSDPTALRSVLAVLDERLRESRGC